MIGRFSNLGTYKQLLQNRELARVLFGAGLTLLGFLLSRTDGVGFQLVGQVCIVSAIAINGFPVVLGAIKGLLERRVNVDELLALAIVACLLQREFLTAAVVSTIMVLGALIEEITAESARKSIQSLINITPKHATKLTAGKATPVPIEEVQVDDLLLIKAGDQVPVDGIIVDGYSAVDEATITGEPLPQEKQVGDEVFAGTLNINGALQVRALRVGESTTLGQVIHLVAEAEAHKPKTIAFIDRFARFFTPFILACALLAWIGTGEFSRAVTVLIVGCPCALILAVPTATVAAIGRAARFGILVKGGQHFEKVADVDTILFDKTGTLTVGNPQVVDIFPCSPLTEREVLQLAAGVEYNSTHPLAKAVVEEAQNRKIEILEAKDLFTEVGSAIRGTIHGELVEVGNESLHGGVSANDGEMYQQLHTAKEKGMTPLLVYRAKQLVGILVVSDRVRGGAEQVIARLFAIGVKDIGILSGDHRQSVQMVGDTVGIKRCWHGLLPGEKLKIIKELQDKRAKVLYVGDGINDAPALAAADVGVAMAGRGTEVALETADIALMGDDIERLPFLMRLSRRMLFIIKLNIAFGLVFNAVSVFAGASGLLSPILGAVVHNIGSVLVVLSSASLGVFQDRIR